MDRLPSSPWRARFAPAPTGYLHLGHAVNALFVWGLARAFGGRVVLRVEDHDRTRSRPEYEAALREDLDWLGLAPDEEAPRQSERGERYAEVLSALTARGLTYPCTCTRKQIRARLANQQDQGEDHERDEAEGRPGGSPPGALRDSDPGQGAEIRYPGTCRERGLDPGLTPIRRLRLEHRTIAFDDLAVGPCRQVPAEQCGDLLLRNRAGHWTYHFAVVVDDLDQGIDVVIRGEDLLASTGRQIQLAELLASGRVRRYLHHPLVLDGSGRKLSKSRGDTGIRELREAGWPPERVLGEAARRAGLQTAARPLRLVEVAEIFERSTAP